MKRFATAGLIALMTLTSAALAQTDSRIQPGGSSGALFKGTAEEQKACSPDATKFCLDEMPNDMRVLACLQQHREKLRKVCLQVLEAHGQ